MRSPVAHGPALHPSPSRQFPDNEGLSRNGLLCKAVHMTTPHSGYGHGAAIAATLASWLPEAWNEVLDDVLAAQEQTGEADSK